MQIRVEIFLLNIMKKDIENRDDIRRLVDHFYRLLLENEEVSYLFTDIAKIDLTEHLPHVYDFWESALFNLGTYGRNTMQPHLDLHMDSPLKEIHFQTWIALFNESVDAYFEGEKASVAKKKAYSIAMIMKLKINQLEQWRKEINN